MTISGKTGDFWPEEIKRLQKAYNEFKQRKSEGTGSAWGEHYKLAKMLGEMGVNIKGKDSVQIEAITEHILIYRSMPKDDD